MMSKQGGGEGEGGTASSTRAPPCVVSSQVLPSPGFRWIRMRKLQYLDDDGEQREWESAERTTRRGEVDGVHIVALLRRTGRPDCMILVSQFRPPVDAVCWEFPAGLVDDGETPTQAAIRELREETGYHVTHDSAIRETTPLVADPGMSNANDSFVFLELDGDMEENRNPQPNLDIGEHVQTHLVPLDESMDFLAQRYKDGDVIDVRLTCFLEGLKLGENARTFFPTKATTSASRPGTSAASLVTGCRFASVVRHGFTAIGGAVVVGGLACLAYSALNRLRKTV